MLGPTLVDIRRVLRGRDFWLCLAEPAIDRIVGKH